MSLFRRNNNLRQVLSGGLRVGGRGWVGGCELVYGDRLFEISEDYTYPVNTLYEHVNENNRNFVTHSYF